MNFAISNNNNNPGSGYSGLNPNSKPFSPRGPNQSVSDIAGSRFFKLSSGDNFDISGYSSGLSNISNSDIQHFNDTGILEQPQGQKDDLGLRGLLRSVEQNRGETSFLSREDIGLPEDISETFKPVHEKFDSPFSQNNAPLVNFLASYHKVPSEYIHPDSVVERLPKPDRLPTEVLFFFFYFGHQDALQLMAACELFDRGWRFNKVSQVWIGRFPNCPPDHRTDKMERGHYQFFNFKEWKRERTYMVLKYEELMERTPPPINPKRLLQMRGQYLTDQSYGNNLEARRLNFLDPQAYPALQSSNYARRMAS